MKDRLALLFIVGGLSPQLMANPSGVIPGVNLPEFLAHSGEIVTIFCMLKNDGLRFWRFAAVWYVLNIFTTIVLILLLTDSGKPHATIAVVPAEVLVILVEAALLFGIFKFKNIEAQELKNVSFKKALIASTLGNIVSFLIGWAVLGRV